MAGDGLEVEDRTIDRAANALDTLRAALAKAPHGLAEDAGVKNSASRIEARSNRAAPEEGLALLSAFLRIDEPDVRQAVLDVVTTIGEAAR